MDDWRNIETALREARRILDNSRGWTSKSKTDLKNGSKSRSGRGSTFLSFNSIMSRKAKTTDVGLLVESRIELERVRLEVLNRNIIVAMTSALSHSRIDKMTEEEMMGLLNFASDNSSGETPHHVARISTRDIDVALSDWSSPNRAIDSFLLDARHQEIDPLMLFGKFPSEEADKMIATARLIRDSRMALKQRSASLLQHSLRILLEWIQRGKRHNLKDWDHQ